MLGRTDLFRVNARRRTEFDPRKRWRWSAPWPTGVHTGRPVSNGENVSKGSEMTQIRPPAMDSTWREISGWLQQRVMEIEQRHEDHGDPHAEDVRQLCQSLRLAMLGTVRLAQAGQVNFATNMFKFAAIPFREYEGYRPEWAIEANTQ